MTQSRSNAKGAFHALVKTLGLLLGASLTLSAQAESNNVECAFQSTYTSVEGRGLYVQSGLKLVPGGPATTQAFMIDLSKSWTIDNPSIKRLADGTGGNYFPSGISSDGKSWYVLKGDRGEFYNATANAWSQKFRLYIQGTAGLTGATDHANNMLDNTPFSLSKKSFYATAWNPLRKSLIYVGTNGVFEYTWVNGWKSFFNKGLDAISMSGSCLVSVSGGSKMALFGGVTQDGSETTADLYILDLTKAGKEAWTKVPVDPSQKDLYARKEAACGSSGDQVVIWGGSMTSGYNGTEHICPSQQTVVFNVKTLSWTDKYVAPK